MAYGADEVKAILAPGTDYDLVNNPSLTPFINKANAILARVVTCATTKGITLSSDEQDIIGAWLAAHYYVCSDQTYASRSTAGASGSFHGQTGKGLESSRYGQSAMESDPSGCLKSVTMGNRATLFWGGTTESSRLTYDERN